MVVCSIGASSRATKLYQDPKKDRKINPTVSAIFYHVDPSIKEKDSYLIAWSTNQAKDNIFINHDLKKNRYT
jgi:hypothetical protein